MSANDRGKLGDFLAEVIDWRWDEFCVAEKDPNYSGYQSTVFSLVRTCADGRLGAIKLAIDRVDGKLETPVKIEYPKIWYVYPQATSVAELPDGPTPALALPDPDALPETAPEVIEPEVQEGSEAAVTMTLRQMVTKMADQPSKLVPMILAMKRRVESVLADGGELQETDMVDGKIPLVKTVIAANLLHLAIERNNFEAITEVFDQIDGKLVETIRVLADDVFLTQYALVAPFGSVKNKEGVYMLEAREVADQWKQKLRRD